MTKWSVLLLVSCVAQGILADRLIDSYSKLRQKKTATSYSSSKLGKASRKIENMDYSDDFYDYFNIDPVDIKTSSRYYLNGFQIPDIAEYILLIKSNLETRWLIKIMTD